MNFKGKLLTALRRLALLAGVASIGIGLMPTIASANQGSAEIDLYVTSGYGDYTPCVRTVSGGQAKYWCRSQTLGPFDYPADGSLGSAQSWWFAGPGDASGGNGYVVFMSNGQFLEGCNVPNLYGVDFSCSSGVTNLSVRKYSTSSWSLLGNALYTSANNQVTVVECAYALYTQDPQGVAESCIG